MELHPNLAPLSGLVGTFAGRGGGRYPTIEGFEYLERVTFSHMGKPLLSYVQTTTSLDGGPMHSEQGYLRALDDGTLEWVVAQPTGHTEVGTGSVLRDGSVVTISLRSDVRGTPSAKDVSAVQREFVLDGDTLRSRLDMAAVGQEMAPHLGAELTRE